MLFLLQDECGVMYTSTKKKVLSKSVAEDMMSREAIKDVFWNGMYSQQPAHFIDHSVRQAMVKQKRSL